ncbi:MAG: glycoside hydrolase family 25 protein [Phyllobacterium sp.]
MLHRRPDQRMGNAGKATAKVVAFLAICVGFASGPSAHAASEFQQPWLNKKRALILDGYEHNEFSLPEIVKDQRIAAFIHKGSDGMPANYHCSREAEGPDRELCKKTWRNYSVSRELYHTRRALAKALGLKWGAYHLARPGNPIEQANHFLRYAEPADDELMALDIEDNDPEKWMSLSDAELFVEHIKRRTGRYPVLYTNGSTAKHIADNRLQYPILSRLPLWYARYKPDIGLHFPKGNWASYALWQFVSQENCTKRSCAYRPPGTNLDIDVNVADMSVAQLKQAWPFDDLIDIIQPDNPPSDDILVASAKTDDAGIDTRPTASLAKADNDALKARPLTAGLFETRDDRSILDMLREPPRAGVKNAALNIALQSLTTCFQGRRTIAVTSADARFAAIEPFL